MIFVHAWTLTLNMQKKFVFPQLLFQLLSYVCLYNDRYNNELFFGYLLPAGPGCAGAPGDGVGPLPWCLS